MGAGELRATWPSWHSTEWAIRETGSRDYQENKVQIAEAKVRDSTLTAGQNRMIQSETWARQIKEGGEGKGS
jgi:hypothetical protein